MKIFPAVALSLLLSSAAVAQTAPGADPSATQNPAMKSAKPMQGEPLAKGKTSFTKGEAHTRIRKAGYSHITGLIKTPDGLWQATATKGGQTVGVSLDYKGNISAQ